MNDRPSVETLYALLRLDAENGRLYWLSRGQAWFKGAHLPKRACAAWNAKHAGREAFTADDGRGYRVGRIFDRLHKAHVVVFAMANGYWPEGEVDHRDCDPGNNRPGNLREATKAENSRNTRPRAGCTSTFKGVSAYRHKWRAYGRGADSRDRHLGYFTSEIDAARAYDAFARREHGDFARLNFPQHGETAA